MIVCALEEMCMHVEDVVSLYRRLFYAIQCISFGLVEGPLSHFK